MKVVDIDFSKKHLVTFFSFVFIFQIKREWKKNALEHKIGNMDFDDLSINRTDINDEVLNIVERKRKSPFAWNGQFSPQFVEAIISTYYKGGKILDPFVGSGTVLAESGRKKIAAVGIELNPGAYHLAKAYEAINWTIEEREKTLLYIKNEIECGADVVSTLKKISSSKTEMVNILSKTLVILMDFYKKEPTQSLALLKLEKLKKIILGLPFSNEVIEARIGDVRNMQVCDDFDFVLTSPPYINVFNYHQNYRKSVEFLGYDVLSIAKNEFGSNRRNRGNRLLTVVEYAIDMALAISRISSAVKTKGRIVFVVGRTSSVLGYSFQNSAIIFDIFSSIFDMKFLLRQERHFTNRFGQVIYEDILHFENKKNSASEEEISKRAREIAKKYLLAQNDKANKNHEKLSEAIEKAEFVLKA